MSAGDTAFASDIIDSTMVGRVVGRREVEVDFRSSALYAAAIGAERDIYLDDRLRDGAMAPPTFIASLEWPLVSGPEFLAAIGVAPVDLFPRLLHLFQDSVFSAPVRVGDRLLLEATLESVSEMQSGARVAVRIRTIKTPSMSPVAESWFGGFFRDMKVASPRTVRSPPNVAPFVAPEFTARDALSISRGASHIYGECARLQNPIHTDLSFSTKLGLPDIALHGTLLWAKMGEIVIDRYLGGNPQNLRRLATRFRRPILPNRAMLIETGLAHCAGYISLQLRDDSSDVLSDGLARFDHAV